MARFKFRMQAVLTQRERAEEEKQLAVAALERERARLETLIRDSHQAIVREKQILRAELLAGNHDAARLQSAATMRLARDAQAAAVELAGVLKKLERARAELLEATKERKAVELLRDHEHEQWRTAQNRAEAAAVDELVVMHAGRKQAP